MDYDLQRLPRNPIARPAFSELHRLFSHVLRTFRVRLAPWGNSALRAEHRYSVCDTGSPTGYTKPRKAVCKYLWGLARGMAHPPCSHFLWVFALALATIQPALGQRDSLIAGALDAYLYWHPDASFEDRDSIQQLLQDWQVEGTYFTHWPRSDYDLIPFLSPTSAFNLSRYVSETGDILDVMEWRAAGLTQAEQVWMKAFFKTGYPKRFLIKSNTPNRIGIQRNSSGWYPIGLYHGLTLGPVWRLGGMRLQFQRPSAPGLSLQGARHTWGIQPFIGGYYSYQLHPSLRLSALRVHNQWGMDLYVRQRGWVWRVLAYPGGFAHAYSFQSKDGVQMQLVRRTAAFSWPSAWSLWATAPGLSVRLPYRRGFLQLTAHERRSQIRFQLREGDVALGLVNGQNCLEARCHLFQDVHVEARLGIMQAQHAWAIHAQKVRGGCRWEGSLGTMGEDALGLFSRLRMGESGAYARLAMHFQKDRYRGWFRCTLRPNGTQIYGSYVLQLDQKCG